jgi:hypothetical protein
MKRTIRILPVLSLAIVMTLGVLGQTSATPQAKPEHLSNHQLKMLIAAAKTPAEHQRIAQYYQLETQNYLAQSEKHKEMLAAYEQYYYRRASFVHHCQYEIQKFTEKAAESQGLAHLQELMATDIEQESTESGLVLGGIRKQPAEIPQRDLYAVCISSTKHVEGSAHAMMPSRFWRFDNEEYQTQLDQLRSAVSTLSQNQSAFEASLTPEQVSTFDRELRAIHQLETQVENHIQNLDGELRDRQAAKWRVAEDTTAFPSIAKKWRRLDQTIARQIGLIQR